MRRPPLSSDKSILFGGVAGAEPPHLAGRLLARNQGRRSRLPEPLHWPPFPDTRPAFRNGPELSRAPPAAVYVFPLLENVHRAPLTARTVPDTRSQGKGGLPCCRRPFPPHPQSTTSFPDQEAARAHPSPDLVSTRRNALLPFALFVEPVAPVPVGVHISENGCCHLSAELNGFRRRRPSFRRALAVTRTRRFCCQQRNHSSQISIRPDQAAFFNDFASL